MSKSSFNHQSHNDSSTVRSSITSNNSISDDNRNSLQKSSIGSEDSMKIKIFRNQRRNKDPGTPRSIASESDYDDDDITSTKSNDSNRGLNFFSKVAKTAVKAFVDYGPPYNDRPFRPNLVDECAKPVANNFKIHNLLNGRENPNLPDPDDLYYYPIHWCARNAHFLALKMLIRAGAYINVTTELGNTPLDMCIMMKVPPDKRSNQLKTVKYLLERDADVNTRDKGGFSPIDHAAYNQDLEIITMLLDYGANVLRRNQTLVAQRTHILKHVYDPECYKVLNDKLMEEEEEIQQEKEREEARKREEQIDNHLVELLVSLSKKKQKKIQREKERKLKEDNSGAYEKRRQKLQDDMEKNLKEKQDLKIANGIWKKVNDDHWELKEKTKENMSSSDLYASCKDAVLDLKERSSIDRYNKVWNDLTKGGKLEMKWKRGKAFDFLSDSLDAVTKDGHRTIEGKSANQSNQTGKALTSIEYRDENDAELEGEDLDDLMAAMAL